jgi:hypothetical protein
MEIAMVVRLALVLFVVLASATAVLAQEGSIVQSADPVKLRLFWAQQGPAHQSSFGNGFGGIPDIDGDGYDDIVVASANPWRYWLFHGDAVRPWLDTSWSYDSAYSYEFPPMVGRVLGGNQRFLALGRFREERYNIDLLRIDSGRIDKRPAYIWKSTDANRPGVSARLLDLAVADLDHDGADELICFALFLDGDVNPRWSRIWIYKGGEGFQLDTPDVELLEPGWESERSIDGEVGDIDGDGNLDVITTQGYAGRGTVMNIWFGDGRLPTARRPDRSFEVTIGFWHLVDADGDGVQDIMEDQRLYLSSKGRSARTRSFAEDDVDFVISDIRYFAYSFGPLNNRSGKYDMLGPSAYDQAFGPKSIVYSGGPNGPDHVIDAVFFPYDHGFLGDVDRRGSGPAGDINGDGWSDFLFGNPEYYDPGVDVGIVGILAGGPYIPVDDPAMSVRHVVTGEHPRALSIWPNPVRERLNIAWRGDLAHRPTRFEIVDARGAIVADGTVDPSIGLATWNSAAVPPGMYVVRVFGERGVPLATTTFVKE